MSYLEAAYQLRDSATLMVASQITVPFAGWPYDTILPRLAASPPPTPLELAKTIADAYVNQFRDVPASEKLAMTVLDLTAAGNLNTLIFDLATAIEASIRGDQFKSETVALFRDVFTSATGGDVRPLIDLTRLCKAIDEEEHPAVTADIRKAASNLLDTIQPRPDPKRKPLIACHASHPDLDDVRGIGIFVPAVSDEGTLAQLELQDRSPDTTRAGARAPKRGRESYEELALFHAGGQKNPVWPSLVYDGLGGLSRAISRSP